MGGAISLINRATVPTEQCKYLLLSAYYKTPSVFSKGVLVLLNLIVKEKIFVILNDKI